MPKKIQMDPSECAYTLARTFIEREDDFKGGDNEILLSRYEQEVLMLYNAVHALEENKLKRVVRPLLELFINANKAVYVHSDISANMKLVAKELEGVQDFIDRYPSVDDLYTGEFLFGKKFNHEQQVAVMKWFAVNGSTLEEGVNRWLSAIKVSGKPRLFNMLDGIL